jgi:predicted O-methyltransferase YrrM
MKIKKLASQVEDALNQIPMDFGGGCSVSKATLMAWLILHERVDRSIDIGVYRGRSFIPQAIAHKLKKSGTVYGIDPYTQHNALEKDNLELGAQIKDFVNKTNFAEIYKDVKLLQKKFDVTEFSKLVRKTSSNALSGFMKDGTTFGLIHIDGNHDSDYVIEDLKKSYSVLEDGGYLVLDDISWTPVKPAVHAAINDLGMRLLYSRTDLANDYCVLSKGNSKLKDSYLRARLGAFSDF